MVQRQAAAGLGVVNDGEMAKSSVSGYLSDGLTGLEDRAGTGQDDAQPGP
jgi:hypothetical protein